MVTGIGGTPGYGHEYSRSGGPEQQQEIQDAYTAFHNYTAGWQPRVDKIGIPLQDYQTLVAKLEKIRDDSKMPHDLRDQAGQLLDQLANTSTAYPQGLPGSPIQFPAEAIDKNTMLDIVNQLGNMKV